MKYIRFVSSVTFACSLLLGIPHKVAAQELETPPSQVTLAADFNPRISSYHPSFFGWAVGEDQHVNFQVSIKYPFLPFEACGINTNLGFIGYKSGLYLAYSSRYDLYFQRDSRPVISREQTPGFYFDFNRCFDQPITLTLGYFHNSNGQVVDTREKYLEIGEHARDFVSRGWDYILFGAAVSFKLPWFDRLNQETPFPFPKGGTLSKLFKFDPTSDQAKLYLYVQGLGFMEKQGFGTAWKEENIFWEDVSVQPRRSDFDGIRVSMVMQNAYYRLSDTLRTGYSAFHLTNDLSFTFRVQKWLPISVQWHVGYGPNLSDYHIASQRVILGFELYDYTER